MSGEVFMRELEYLLQDISDEEKAEAIQYYKDYFDEAGPENETQVCREFGSPERVAAIIRSDLAGNLESGGEFTESGYQDERFKDPNYQMAKRYDLPEASDAPVYREERSETQKPRTSRILKLILWIILIVTVAPPLLGIGSGIFGIAVGLFAVLLVILIGVGILTVALLIAGVAIFVAGIVTIVIHPLNGMLLLGISALVLGLGILSLVISVLFYGKLIPSLIRGLTDGIGSLIHRKRG